MENNVALKDLEQKQEYFRTKMYFLMVEVAFIFGVPAVVAGLVANKQGASSQVTTITLFCTFIFSWVIVVFRYRYAKRNLDSIKKAIDAEKKKV
jgi:uncharacterized membrane protein (DUF485 family)